MRYEVLVNSKVWHGSKWQDWGHIMMDMDVKATDIMFLAKYTQWLNTWEQLGYS